MPVNHTEGLAPASLASRFASSLPPAFTACATIGVLGTLGTLDLNPVVRTGLGVVAGVGIGIAATLMGVAGGELLIPTIVLLFAVDIKIAGRLSQAVSLPTMLVAFARYAQDDSFGVLRRHRGFVVAMTTGSVVGTLSGGLLLGVIPNAVLIPALIALLLASSFKVWRHQ